MTLPHKVTGGNPQLRESIEAARASGRNRNDVLSELLRGIKPDDPPDTAQHLADLVKEVYPDKPRTPPAKPPALNELVERAAGLLRQGRSAEEVQQTVKCFNEQLANPVPETDLAGALRYLFESHQRKVEAAAPPVPDPTVGGRISTPAGAVWPIEPISENAWNIRNIETEETEETERDISKRNETERVPRGAEDRRSSKKKTRRAIFEKELPNGTPSSLTFAEYLACVVEEFNAPQFASEPEPWHTELFYFVRLVKTHPSMARRTCRGAFNEVVKVMRSWRSQLKPEDKCKDVWWAWLDMNADDAEAEFFDSWEKVRVLVGFSPLENAVEIASRKPLNPRAGYKGERPSAYPRFISLAGWLQVSVGDQPILLPCHEVGELLKLSKQTIMRYRRWAVEDGFLEVIKEHRPPEGGQPGEATRFHFFVERFPILKDATT